MYVYGHVCVCVLCAGDPDWLTNFEDDSEQTRRNNQQKRIEEMRANVAYLTISSLNDYTSRALLFPMRRIVFSSYICGMCCMA